MKRTLWLAALGLAAVAPAVQQDTFGYPSNLSLRLGWVYPIDSVTRDNSRSLIGVGAEYFLDRSLLADGETTISFDWLGKSGSGAKGNIFPILVNQKWYNKNITYYGTRSYVFVGAGIAVVDVNNTKTTIAGRIGFGVELGPRLFAEANLLVSDNAGGAKANSAGVYFGYKF